MNNLFSLSAHSTKSPPDLDKTTTKKATEKLLTRLAELQNLINATASHSVLVVVQGMDASGKDGAIKSVFSGLNPLGLQTYSFKTPSILEAKHDFLWRVHAACPPRGIVGVFNRSHYEEVLITRTLGLVDDQKVTQHFKNINAFEQLLVDNNTIVLKFYLHVSEKEQIERLEERKTNPEKYWKHNEKDWETIQKRSLFLTYYEQIFEHCSSASPWHIVPSDHNWFKTYFIAQKTVEAIERLGLKYA